MVSRPGLDPVTLDVYDVYIIKGSWCGAKGQGPAVDRLCYVLGFKLSPMVYRGIRHILCWPSCKYAS